MRILPLKAFAWTTAALSLAAGSPILAAPMTVSGADYLGSFNPGTPESITGDAVLFSLTTVEGTFANLLGATANAVVTTNTLSSIGTIPVNANAAVTGLSVNDGINNLQSGNFQLGGTFDVNTRFFILESAPQSGTLGDPVTVTLIDSSNAQVGTFTLNLTAANFTLSAAGTTSTALATVTYTTFQGTAAQKLGAVTFSLADFSGAGDIGLATGIRLASPGAAGGASILDPNVVGSYSTVPEPATWLMMFAGLGVVFGFRNIRRAAAL